ncbi:MAG TPA: Ig-like domain-containing protein, partial [Treponemataceae bacterium]|nr:Ig-like domain-containing protein [Treponemataceae bacterium]
MKKLREHISLKAIITSVMILTLIIASCSFDLEPAWKNSEKTAIIINFSTFSSENENITETRALIKGRGNLYLVLDAQVYGPYLATPGIPFITTDIPSGTYSFVMALFSATILDKLSLSSIKSNSLVSEIATIGSGQFTYQSLNDFTVVEGKTNEMQLTLIPAVGSELTLNPGSDITLTPETGEITVCRFLKTGDYTSGLSQGETISAFEITTVNLAQTPGISLTAELSVYGIDGKRLGDALPINQVTGDESTYILNQPGEGPYFIYIEYTTANAESLQLRMNLTIGIVEATPFTLTETEIGSEDLFIFNHNDYTISGTVTSLNREATLKAFRGSTQILLTTSVVDANTVKWDYTESDLADGSYTYVITATNSASEEKTLTRKIQVDATAPYIVINTPSTGQTINYVPFTFNGSVTDSTSGVKNLEYSFDNIAWNETSYMGGDWSFIYNKVTNGNFTLYVRATDNAGNIISETKNFTLYLPAFTLTETEIGSEDLFIFN